MKAIKITDLTNHPISYTEFAGRVIFGGKVPSRFEPGNTYNSGDYAYIVNDGELEVWRCTQRGTYLEITSVSWVKATIPNIVAELLKYLDIVIPDSDVDYDTTKCFDCRSLFTFMKSGTNAIPVVLTNDIILNAQFIDIFINGLYIDKSMYIIDDSGTLILNNQVTQDSDVVIVYRDPMNSVSGLVDCYERILTNIDGYYNIFPLPEVPSYIPNSPDYIFYVNGKLLSTDAYQIISTDDIDGYTGSYTGYVVEIFEFITISGKISSFSGNVYIGKNIISPNEINKVVCCVTYSSSSKMDVLSMHIQMPMTSDNKYKFNIYDSFYYNEDNEIMLMTDKYGPITQKELLCTDTTLTVLNKNKPINNINSIIERNTIQNRFLDKCSGLIKSITGPSTDGKFHTIINNRWCDILLDGKTTLSSDIIKNVHIDSSKSFILSSPDGTSVYASDYSDGNNILKIPYNSYDDGDISTINLGLTNTDIPKSKYAAIYDNIIYLFISDTVIRKIDTLTDIVTVDDTSLKYDIMNNGCFTLPEIDGVFYAINSIDSNILKILSIDSQNLNLQNIIDIQFDIGNYEGDITPYICSINHILYIYINGLNQLIMYSPRDGAYAITPYTFDIDSMITPLYNRVENISDYDCVISNINDSLCMLRQCDVTYNSDIQDVPAYSNHIITRMIEQPSVNDVILSYRQYIYSDIAYDGDINKICAATVPVIDTGRKSIGIPFSNIDESHYFLLFDNNGLQISNIDYYIDIDHNRIVSQSYAFEQGLISVFNTTKTKLCTTIEYSVVCTDSSTIIIPSSLFDKSVSVLTLFDNDGRYIQTTKYTISSDGTIVSNGSEFIVGSVYRILLEQYNTLSFDTAKDIRHITVTEENQSTFELPFTYSPTTDMMIIYSPSGTVLPPYQYTINNNSIVISDSIIINVGDEFDIYITRFLETPATINEIDAIREAL